MEGRAGWLTNPLTGNGAITCKYITLDAWRKVQICLINTAKQHGVLLYFLHHMFEMMETDTRYTLSCTARWTFSPESVYSINFPDTSVDSPHREVNTSSLSPWLYFGLFPCLYAHTETHICRGTRGGMELLKKTKTDSAVQARRCLVTHRKLPKVHSGKFSGLSQAYTWCTGKHSESSLHVSLPQSSLCLHEEAVLSWGWLFFDNIYIRTHGINF